MYFSFSQDVKLTFVHFHVIKSLKLTGKKRGNEKLIHLKIRRKFSFDSFENYSQRCHS